MRTSEAKRSWQHGWVLGLALLSLVVPIANVFLGLSDERQQVAVLVIGLACPLVALIGSRVQTITWFRWLSVVLACLGGLLSAFLLVGLIGLCGAQVFWGVCSP